MSFGPFELIMLFVSILILAGLGYGVFVLVRLSLAAIARRIRR